MSYVEKCAEFKNQTLKKSAGPKVPCATEYPQDMQYLKIALKWGVPLQVYNLNHVILVVKCKRSLTVWALYAYFSES